MANVTPAGPNAIALDSLRTLIANVPFFQTWTGSANAAAALSRIFTGEVGVSIASVSAAPGTVTFTTRQPHGFTDGQTATIEGPGLGAQSQLPIDGPQTIGVVDAVTFTVYAAGAPHTDVFYPGNVSVFGGQRPIATIGESKDALSSDAIGTGGFAIYSGGLEVLIEADVTGSYVNDPANALAEARSSAGQMVQGLQETADTGDLMFIGRCELVSGPEFISRSRQTDNTARFEQWQALLRVTWGLDG